MEVHKRNLIFDGNIRLQLILNEYKLEIIIQLRTGSSVWHCERGKESCCFVESKEFLTIWRTISFGKTMHHRVIFLYS